jgi:hypothetical protein
MAPVTISAAAAQPGAAAQRSSPGRDELTDALALLALTMIGIVGFRPAYGGQGYLAAGAAGIIIGLLLSYAGQRARLPLLAVAAASVLAFLLFGGVISQTGTVSLPTLQAVTSAAVSGWQQLLTTARPVGRTAGLLALPYLLGLFSGVAGHALARRTRTVLLPVAAPAVVVALSILFGSRQPVAALLQGSGFAVVALAWAAVRQERGTGRDTTIGRPRPARRIAAGLLVLAVAGAGAALAGPHLPGAGVHKRVVLTVVPPFDVDQYPSPLAAFRDYTKDAPAALSVYSKELLATTGLAPKTLVRIAVMDVYDGLTWGVANTASTAADGTFGGFQRVGAVLPGARSGPASTATITIEPAYDEPWLPDVAATGSFGFTGVSSTTGPTADCPLPGATGQSVAAELRYNVATSSGLIPGCVPSGLTYTDSYVSAATPSLAALASADPGGSPSTSIVIPTEVQTFAGEHSQSATTPLGKVAALAAYLKKNGRYSDTSNGQPENVAGHSSGRLTTFLNSPNRQIVGDGEQYAATMALLANAVGAPARVSLDAAVGPQGVITGRDVQADVEVDTSQYGWVTLPARDFTGTQSPSVQRQQVAPPQVPVKVVPPRHNQEAPVASANQGNAVSRSVAKPSAGRGFAIPAIAVTIVTGAGGPVLAVAVLAVALIAAKATRRRRRRALGPPAARIAGAWVELLDLGRDLGISQGRGEAGEPAGPAGVRTVTVAAAVAPTRREFARYAERRGLPAARAVAFAADAATFGPADPDGADAARVWQLVATARRTATARLPWWRRLWVAVNPASLWASRATLEQAIARARRRLAGAGRGARRQWRGGPVPGGTYR